jgi:hypothetical protein
MACPILLQTLTNSRAEIDTNSTSKRRLACRMAIKRSKQALLFLKKAAKNFC